VSSEGEKSSVAGVAEVRKDSNKFQIMKNSKGLNFI
jgi:hypothetical protein